MSVDMLNVFGFSDHERSIINKSLIDKKFKSFKISCVRELTSILKKYRKETETLTSFELGLLLFKTENKSLEEIIKIIQEENYRTFRNLLWEYHFDEFKRAKPEDTKCEIQLKNGKKITHPLEFLNYMYGNDIEFQSKIVSIEWPAYLQNIEKVVLINCKSLERFIFSEKFNVIDSYCFEHCKNINFVKFPREVNLIGKTILPYTQHKIQIQHPIKIGFKFSASYFMRAKPMIRKYYHPKY